MVSGSLTIKKGYYYVVLTWVDENEERHRKWISTGLPQKGNKRKAMEELTRLKSTFEPPKAVQDLSSDMLFTDYLRQWLDIVKVRVKIATFSSYQDMTEGVIILTSKRRVCGCAKLRQGIFSSSILKSLSPFLQIRLYYHAIIYQALKYALKTDMVTQNVAMMVDRPRKNSFQPNFLTAEEMQQMFEIIKGTKMQLPVMVAAFYGLRRGEVLGLKWDAIDFNRGTLTIKRTVTQVKIDGKYQIIEQDSAKTKSSLRTLPLVGSFKEYFEEAKKAQEFNKKVCGDSYNYDYDGYVFVNEIGERMKPDYLTTAFPEYLQRHSMKKIRFHDLRHSCASLLLANEVPLKQIQEWLGHSDFSTTANIYAHLDYTSKISSAQAMENGLQLPSSNRFKSEWASVTNVEEE